LLSHTPGDYTNASAAQYFITSIVNVLSDPAVDGTFTDDVDGVPEEHPAVQAAINMTDAQLAQLQYATLATNMLLIESLVPAQKYNWREVPLSRTLTPPPHRKVRLTDDPYSATYPTQRPSAPRTA
jgi:hypothetical protein